MQSHPAPNATSVDNGKQKNRDFASEAAEELAEVSSTAPQWTVRRVAQATLTALGVGILFFLLYRFYMVIFIFFVAVTLQLAMKPTVEWLKKKGIRTEFGVAFIYLVLFSAIIGFIWLAVPLLVEQFTTVVQQIPGYYGDWRLSLLETPNRLVRAAGMALPETLSFSALSGDATVEASTIDAVTPVWETIKDVSRVSFILLAIFMLAYYWMLESDIAIRRVLFFAPPEQRTEWRQVFSEIEAKIGSYFRGQAILCLVVGALSAVGYLAIGLPYAFALAAVMALMEAIPMIGPILGAVPALLVGLTTEPNLFWWVVGVVSIVQFLENNLLVPKIMDRSVGVHAVVTILAIAAFGVLFGLGGAILAIPLAAILQILFNHFVLNIAISEDVPSNGKHVDVQGRSHISSLRLEAQDLVGDLRKQARSSDFVDVADGESEQIEDLIEAVADDLDSLLSQLEGAA